MRHPADRLLRQALRRANDESPVRAGRVLNQGVTHVTELRTERARYVAKWLSADTPNHVARCEAEAAGLTLLRRAESGLRLPAVAATAHGDEGALLLLEWLPVGRATPRSAARLGEGLARLHRHTAARHGLDHDNFIGPTPQPNTRHDDWQTFFATQRLAPMGEHLRGAGRLPRSRAAALERLIGRLPELLAHDPAPSLLHGDLWSGNWLSLENDVAALIDPAAYFGDREADLAMTRLFGGFPAAFYDAYAAAWPLPPGAAERQPIYNLYHLLNHLLLFGEGYAPAVDRTLSRY